MIKRFLTVLTLVGASILPAAQALARNDLGNLVRIEVLDGGMTERGTYLTALRLHLSDGWKTYWRAPGDAGIPPQFDWRRSSNLGEVHIIWPAPLVFDQGGLQSIGYRNQLVLPVEITPAEPGRPVRLRGKVEIGICKDVCIPGTLSVDHRLDAKAERNPVIAAALAQRPYDRAEAGVTSAICRLTPIKGGMRLEARIDMPAAGGREVAVIEPGNARIWASPAQTRRQGGVLIAASDLVHVDGQGSYALDRASVRITVLGRDHAVDIQGCTPG